MLQKEQPVLDFLLQHRMRPAGIAASGDSCADAGEQLCRLLHA